MATTATTTTYQYPYPLGGDSLSNVATRIKELADRSESVTAQIISGNITLAPGTIYNTNIAATAGITYGKLSLANSITNADLAGSISPSKITGTAITAADTGTVTSTMLLDGTIVNADVNASAAITYSKLNLATSIVNADVSTSAAIAYSKLDLSTYPGHYVCTSSTRPTGIAEGHMIYETDTQRFLVYDGTATWLSIFDTDVWSINNTALQGSSDVSQLPTVILKNYTTDATAGTFKFMKARGTEATPTVAESGDVLGTIRFDGLYTGTTSFGTAASIAAIADGTFSASNVGSYIQFSTITTGTTSPRAERMRIGSNGFVTITGALGRGAPVTKTADFTVGVAENWLINNKAVSSCTVTLPTASSWTGREIMIKNLAAFTVISASSNVKPIGTNTAGTAILPATVGTWCTLVSDGTNWIIMQSGLGL